jgi:hypothetical protein
MQNKNTSGDSYEDFAGRYDILDITHREKEPELKAWSIDLLILPENEQEKRLKEAGFFKVDFYGDFDFSPYDKEKSRRLITVARK